MTISDIPTRAVYDVPQMAEILGISTGIVRKLLREGQIPGKRIGGVWRAHRATFDNWVANEFGKTA